MKKMFALSLSAALLCLFTACGGSTSSDLYKAGTYSAEADGFGGKVAVSVTVDAKKITKVEVTENSETEGIGSNAIDELPGKMVEANSADVEAVSGATVTSTALKEAVTAALESAKK